MSNSDHVAPTTQPSAPPRVARAAIPPSACGAVRASELLGDKWTLQILREAMYGVRRFADFRAELGLPSAALSGRLARLVDAQVLERVEYRDEGARGRSEYCLTARGMDLVYVMSAMMEWGARHLDLPSERTPILRHRETGERLSVGFVRARDGGVDPSDVRLELAED